ncbi:MAG: hypothetical protein Tsb0013_16740 [Phycisphaerales bacterium]
MKTVAKVAVVLVLLAIVVTIGVVDWSALRIADDASSPGAQDGAPSSGGDQAGVPEELPEGACYAGEWVGCWRFQDDPQQQKYLRVHDDGCTITQKGLEDKLHMVFGFRLDERETIGPEGASFTAPRGSVVFYVVPRLMGYDADPVMAVDSRRGPDGRVPETSGVYSGWAILSRAPSGQRTLAVVSRSLNPALTLEDQPPVPEYRITRIECPE